MKNFRSMHRVSGIIMSVKITKALLENEFFKFQSFSFLPSTDKPIHPFFAICTHGYTASKNDCVPWAQRLALSGIPTIVFDLPGHYLGSFEELDKLDDLKEHATECFEIAYNQLKNQMQLHSTNSECNRLFLIGHSLGALLSIAALEQPVFKELEKLSIAIGLGAPTDGNHIFQSEFYEETMNIRKQLVSDELHPDQTIDWINDLKRNVPVKNQRIHLLTGEDDIVVGTSGAEDMKKLLEAKDCEVSLNVLKRLPHHEPRMAATHIYQFIKNNFLNKSPTT